MKYIKPFYILLLIPALIILSACNSPNKKLSVKYKYKNYPSGNTKEKYQYVSGALTSTEYFDEDGYTDSIENYQNGKIFSIVRYSYLEDQTIYADTYKGDSLIEHKVYDSLMNLLYQTPFHIPKVTHTTYKFRSGRIYFDQNKTDTIEIINNDIPPYNTTYSVRGAILSRINRYKAIFSISIHNKNLPPYPIEIWVGAWQNTGDSTEIPLRIDSLIIPVK